MEQFTGRTALQGRSYDSKQLDMFKAVLDEIIFDLRAGNSPLVAPEQVQLTKIRAASAIFFLFEQGEREPARLDQLARAMLHDAGTGEALAQCAGHA